VLYSNNVIWSSYVVPLQTYKLDINYIELDFTQLLNKIDEYFHTVGKRFDIHYAILIVKNGFLTMIDFTT